MVSSTERALRPRKPQVAVLHPGARLDYLAATALAREGMLAGLYTDVVGNRGWMGSIMSGLRAVPRAFVPAPARRLMARVVPVDIPDERLHSATVRGLLDFALQRGGGFGEKLRARLSLEEALRQALEARGFKGLDAIYTFHNTDAALARRARAHGVKIVHDQYLNPLVGRHVREEREAYPGLEYNESEESIEEGIRRDLEKWSVSDLILTPSQFVANELEALGGPVERVRILPYGIDPAWLERSPRPERGRVLFVGAVGLRKGAHILAEATRLLRSRGRDYEVVAVGPQHPSVAKSPIYAGPRYSGQIPRGEVHEEFERADVFAFPTLSDSFAMTHLEALSCGVPVITTPYCGSTVRDGVEGMIIPIRDARALADAIERIVEDRDLRANMSVAAVLRARELTWERYAQRFIGFLEELCLEGP